MIRLYDEHNNILAIDTAKPHALRWIEVENRADLSNLYNWLHEKIYPYWGLLKEYEPDYNRYASLCSMVDRLYVLHNNEAPSQENLANNFPYIFVYMPTYKVWGLCSMDMGFSESMTLELTNSKSDFKNEKQNSNPKSKLGFRNRKCK